MLVAGIPGRPGRRTPRGALNAVVQHLANYTEVGEDAEQASEDEAAPLPSGVSGEDVVDLSDEDLPRGR